MSSIETPEEFVARLWPCKHHPGPGACMSAFASAKTEAVRARDEQIRAALSEEADRLDSLGTPKEDPADAFRAFAARLGGSW